MKKLLTIIGSLSICTLPVTTIISCDSTRNTFDIVFIPSVNATDIQNTIKPLEEALQKYLKEKDSTFNKPVKITTATDYEAAGSSLKNGKSDLAFLPVNTYASYRGSSNDDGTYKDAGVLLISSRNGLNAETNYDKFKVGDDFSDFEASKQDLSFEDLSGLALNYNKLLSDNLNLNEEENSDKLDLTVDNVSNTLFDKNNMVSYYRSYVFANKSWLESEKNNNTSYSSKSLDEFIKDKEVMKNLILSAGKGLSMGKSLTSSGSVLYPLLWMKKSLGLSDENLRDVYKNSSRQNGYPDAARLVSINGDVKMSVGYGDIRYDLKGNVADMKTAFKNSIVIASTTGIPNDGIMYSRKTVNETLVSTLRSAFQTFVKDPNLKSVFDLYNHNQYIGLKTEQTSLEYEKEREKLISDNFENIEPIIQLTKNFN
ncbi:hypothetical protein SCORR_v1c03940 [Spiroplasma corruscae]|uniref:Phosphonate transport system substrate-binding protein n=1 Tax=Spiroplasma corruscae TaxID=216934 RepID=A0A222ENU9_9MOLU|nr:PhnD/SsuA/transferrin family substrate-binding protein [Spiroplasma corruscae]ASP28168.1 hypothetical protein SCORR_v1c03940 [Spiroplasma corruscae]